MEDGQRALEQIRKLRADQGTLKSEIESYAQKINSMQEDIDQITASQQESASQRGQSEQARKQQVEDEEDKKEEEQVGEQRSDDEQRDDEKHEEDAERRKGSDEGTEVVEDEAEVKSTGSASRSEEPAVDAKTGKKVSWSQPPAVTITTPPTATRLSTRQSVALSKSQPDPVKQHEIRLVYGDIADIMSEGVQQIDGQPTISAAVDESDEKVSYSQTDSSQEWQQPQQQGTLKQQLDQEKRMSNKYGKTQIDSRSEDQRKQEANGPAARRMAEASSTTESTAEVQLRKKQENDEALRMIQERHRLHERRLAEQEEQKQAKQQQTMQKEKQSGRDSQSLRASLTQPSPTTRSSVHVLSKPPIRAADDAPTRLQHTQNGNQFGEDERQVRSATRLQAHPSKPTLARPSSAAIKVSKQRAVTDTAPMAGESKQATVVTSAPVASAQNRLSTAKRKAVIDEGVKIEEDSNKRVRKQQVEPSERNAAVAGRETVAASSQRPVDRLNVATGLRAARKVERKAGMVERRNSLADTEAEEIDDVPELAEALAMLKMPKAAAVRAASPKRPAAKRQREEMEVTDLSDGDEWDTPEADTPAQQRISLKRSRLAFNQRQSTQSAYKADREKRAREDEEVQRIIDSFNKAVSGRGSQKTIITETTFNRRTVEQSRSPSHSFTRPIARQLPAVPAAVANKHNSTAHQQPQASKPAAAHSRVLGAAKHSVRVPSAAARLAVCQSPDLDSLSMDDMLEFIFRPKPTQRR